MSEDLKHTSMLTEETETRPAPTVKADTQAEEAKPTVSAKAKAAGKRPFEEWAAEADPPMRPGELYRLPFFTRWPARREVTKAEFDAAREGAANVGIRAGKHPKAEESKK